MNQHIVKAKEFADKGDGYYARCVREMVAARADGCTWPTIASGIGRSEMWCHTLVSKHKSLNPGEDLEHPFGGKTAEAKGRGAVEARRVAREAPEKIIEDPEARREIGRALDEHYTREAKASAKRQRSKEVERKGGEDEYADHQRRQHVAEVVSVARGATSGWRFVAGQIKSLELDSGAADELAALADETEGFLSMFRSVLAGEAISDSDLAELLKEEA